MEYLATHGTFVMFRGKNLDGSYYFMISRTGFQAGPIFDSPDREAATAKWDEILELERYGKEWIDKYAKR